jgi:hypothetical protein
MRISAALGLAPEFFIAADGGASFSELALKDSVGMLESTRQRCSEAGRKHVSACNWGERDLLRPSWPQPLRGRRCASSKIAPGDFVEPTCLCSRARIPALLRDELRSLTREILDINWRRERDSNPRRAFDPYTLSRGAPSTTRPSLRFSRKPSCFQLLESARGRPGRHERAAMILKHPPKGKRAASPKVPRPRPRH